MISCLPGGMATPWLIIIRITVCQPFAVYPAPTRLPKVWATGKVAATISFPPPSGNSSARAASATQKRTAAIEDECNLLGIAISRARNRCEPPACALQYHLLVDGLAAGEAIERQRGDVHAGAASARDQLGDRAPCRRRVHHPMSREAIREEESGNSGGTDHRVVIRRHFVEARPAPPQVDPRR